MIQLTPLQILISMASTANEDRLQAAIDAMQGNCQLPDPMAGQINLTEICKAYGGIHKATAHRRFKANGIKSANVIAGLAYYRIEDVVEAFGKGSQ
jgi:hypothetical protein